MEATLNQAALCIDGGRCPPHVLPAGHNGMCGIARADTADGA
jgi:hypothetical protein